MQHRLIRITLHPGKEQWHVAVVARSVSRHGGVDRILWRGVCDDPGDLTRVAPLLLAVSDALVDVARRMEA